MIYHQIVTIRTPLNKVCYAFQPFQQHVAYIAVILYKQKRQSLKYISLQIINGPAWSKKTGTAWVWAVMTRNLNTEILLRHTRIACFSAGLTVVNKLSCARTSKNEGLSWKIADVKCAPSAILSFCKGQSSTQSPTQ